MIGCEKKRREKNRVLVEAENFLAGIFTLWWTRGFFLAGREKMDDCENFDNNRGEREKSYESHEIFSSSFATFLCPCVREEPETFLHCSQKKSWMNRNNFFVLPRKIVLFFYAKNPVWKDAWTFFSLWKQERTFVQLCVQGQDDKTFFPS